MFNYSNCNNISCFNQEFIFTVFLAFIYLGLGILLLHVYDRLKDWYRLYKLNRPPFGVLFKIYPLFRKTYLIDYYEIIRMLYSYVMHVTIFISAGIITYNTYTTTVLNVSTVQLTALFITLAIIFGLIAAVITAASIVFDSVITTLIRVYTYKS